MLARFAIRNSKVIVFIVFVLALLGVRAYLGTSAGIFPVMTFARVDVVADAGSLPPDRVRFAVAEPLARALQAVPDVTSVVATSSQGSADVSVTFSEAMDPRVAREAVDQALASARSDIPAARSIVAESVSPSREPIVSYALTSNDLSPTVLRAIATTQIVPKLYGTPGLGRVLVSGGSTAEFVVAFDPARLASLGIAAADVEKALADASVVRSVGVADRGYQRYNVLVDAAPRDRVSLASVRIALKAGASVALGDIARISLGVAPATSETSFADAPAVVLSAYAPPAADAVATARELSARVRALSASLPRDVKLQSFWDQTTLVVASQAALRDAIVLGALLAIAVIYAFLRDLRLTLVAAAIIPLALAIALFALQVGGQTLNLMSVGGLAVAVGLIIDDAIVVVEGIARDRADHPSHGVDRAVERTMARLAGPMIASTATTVVVFVPLALLGGVTGFFFRALAFTLSAALVVSLGLALFVTPLFARTFLQGSGEGERRDLLARVLHAYDTLLRWSLGHRIVVACASLAIFAATVVLLAAVPSDFLPNLDEGQFEIGYTLPVGTSLRASDAAARDMERVISADPAVDSVAGLTGLDSNGITPTQPNIGALRVRLKPPAARVGYAIVAARLRDRLSSAVPAAIFDFRQILEDVISDLSGDTAPIEITLRGTDQRTIASIAATVAERIGRVPGVVDAASGIVYAGPTLRVTPRGAALAARGLGASDLGDALATLGTGDVATTLPGSLGPIPVRVAIAGAGANAAVPNDSTRAPLGGGSAALGSIAHFSTERYASDIVTQNGELIDRVTARTEGTSLSRVIAGIRKVLAAIAFPPGYSAELGGQARSQARSFAEFTNVIALAVVLVFAVMLATFRSFRIPLVILTAVPLALIGVAIALALTGTAFNVSSLMGLLLLVGIVVKNGILLVDAANRNRSAGASLDEALSAAGRARLRPIVMTTLAAIGGLLPLALGFGQGAEMEKPLAIAVIGGLSTATLFTLVVIPVIYATFSARTGHAPSRTRALPAMALIAAFVLAPHSANAQEGDAPLVFVGLSLDAAARAAIASAPDVLAARASLDERRAALASARASISPSVAANYAQVPQGNPPGPNIVSRQVGAIVQVSVADFVSFAPSVRAAAFAYAAAESSERSAELGERLTVSGLYFDALKARAIAVAARDAQALAVAQRDAARVRFTAGDAARLDVTRADVEVAKADATLALAIASDENATAALASETGMQADALAQTTPAEEGGMNTAADPQIAAARARANRPEIAAARALAGAATADISAAKAGAFPTFTVGAGYVVGTDSGVSINAPTIVASLTLPLGTGAHDRVAAAAARASATRASALGVERKILVDVAAAARMLGAAARASNAMLRERDAAQAELRASELGYRTGAASSLEVTAARTAYAQAVVDTLSARYDVEKARAALEIEEGQ